MVIKVDGSFFFGTDALEFLDVLGDKENFFLFDCVSGGMQPPMVNAKTLVTASPNEERYGDYAKSFCSTLFMPVWSLPELELCRQHCFPTVSEEDLCFLFERWGGIARGTLEKAVDDAMADLGAAFRAVDLRAVLEVLRLQTLNLRGRMLTHRLVHIITDDFCTFGCEFGSHYIYEELMRRAEGAAEAECEHFLNTTKCGNIMAAARGHVFELYAHRKLCREKSVEVRSIRDKRILRTLVLSDGSGSMATQRFRSVEEMRPGLYCVPLNGRFAVFDSFVPPTIAFQMTVSLDHGLNLEGLEALLKRCRDLRTIVWVVPEDIYDDFPRQSFKKGKTVVKKGDVSPRVAALEQVVLKISWKH